MEPITGELLLEVRGTVFDRRIEADGSVTLRLDSPYDRTFWDITISVGTIRAADGRSFIVEGKKRDDSSHLVNPFDTPIETNPAKPKEPIGGWPDEDAKYNPPSTPPK
ncbi:MAG: hypothetical protein AAB646_01045 [Patescibacteria group bacterium]